MDPLDFYVEFMDSLRSDLPSALGCGSESGQKYEASKFQMKSQIQSDFCGPYLYLQPYLFFTPNYDSSDISKLFP